MGDRFYGTADLIGWCQKRTWDYRLRLKGNLVVFDGPDKTTTGKCAKDRVYYLENVELTGRRARTHIGIIHDPGHAEPWIVAMSEKPGYLRTLEYADRWGIEPMFSDFKSRGFGIEDTQLRYADRLDRLILVMALYVAVSTGQAVHHPTPSEKKSRGPAQKSRPKQNLLVHPRNPPHRQVDAILPAAATTLECSVKLIDAKPLRCLQDLGLLRQCGGNWYAPVHERYYCLLDPRPFAAATAGQAGSRRAGAAVAGFSGRCRNAGRLSRYRG
jgi:hypothetical protein